MVFSSLVSRAWSTLRRKSDCYAAARSLHQMTDHELADIGISRDQIDDLVHGRCVARTQLPKTSVKGLFSQRPAFAKAAATV